MADENFKPPKKRSYKLALTPNYSKASVPPRTYQLWEQLSASLRENAKQTNYDGDISDCSTEEVLSSQTGTGILYSFIFYIFFFVAMTHSGLARNFLGGLNSIFLCRLKFNLTSYSGIKYFN
jgi:hypothetical protein